jgi:hypothetical protein
LPLFVINGVFGQGEAICRCWPCRCSSPAWRRCLSACRSSALQARLIATRKPSIPLKNRRLDRLAASGVRHCCGVVAGLDRCLAVFVGLEAVPLMLLALSTAVLFYLYRIPRQLG